MSTFIKLLIGIVVLAAIVAGAWYAHLLDAFMPKITSEVPIATTTPQQTAQVQNDLPTSSNDPSDEAIMQDSRAVDAQISSLSSDSASIDQSMNDQPVSQEY